MGGGGGGWGGGGGGQAPRLEAVDRAKLRPVVYEVSHFLLKLLFYCFTVMIETFLFSCYTCSLIDQH